MSRDDREEAPTAWHDLADRVLQGHRLTEAEGLAVLQSDDAQLLDLLSAAYRVRYRHFGNRVHLNFLINAKSGLCSEDCGYCSQSRVSRAAIPTYPLLDADRILDGARAAAERQAKTYCIVASGKALGEEELDRVCQVVQRIKTEHALKVCVSPGLLTDAQAGRLAACGVDRVNHNLNTSRPFYPRICTTHDYQDRLDTLAAVRRAGMEICSGGIVGMGETPADVVELALEMRQFDVEALPVNFLQPIVGTPLEEAPRGDPLTPRYCLKVLALFRLANPQTELRIGAGREMHLGCLQPLGLYPANSIFVGDYLTTEGQPPSDDYRMIEALGFEIVTESD
ncbi:MAG: biotin synthase BioB [Planctomycetes bacterium]|nr:biotin synthase BioB [Planctomycetota bacterium]